MTSNTGQTEDHKFTFGLWTVGNPGRDSFGEPTRRSLSPAEIVHLLGEVGGVHGVNFHDNDLIPFGASQSESERIRSDFRGALDATGLRVAMATTNLFSNPAFKDGAFTSNDADVRAFAVEKTKRAMDLGAEFGAKVFVMWGGREGCESDACKDPIESLNRYRDSFNALCRYSGERGYDYRFALEPKPNEPRGHIFLPTVGHCLAFITTLEDPGRFGVNPEVAHEQMVGLNFSHAVAMAIWMNKLFHIDLNDQEPGRYDQDYRFGSGNLKAAFFLVKVLEDNGYTGFKHFDSHAYRSADRTDVIEFARGSMRTYRALCDAVRRWHADEHVQRLLSQIRALDTPGAETCPGALAARRLPYEELDQRTMDMLMGIS